MPDDAFTQKFLDAWNSHNVEAALALMTSDCVFEPSVGLFPWGDRLYGHGGIQSWALETFQRIPDIRWELLHHMGNVGHAVLEYRVTGTPNGAKPLDVYACDILTIRNGLISGKRAYRKVQL